MLGSLARPRRRREAEEPGVGDDVQLVLRQGCSCIRSIRTQYPQHQRLGSRVVSQAKRMPDLVFEDTATTLGFRQECLIGRLADEDDRIDQIVDPQADATFEARRVEFGHVEHMEPAQVGPVPYGRPHLRGEHPALVLHRHGALHVAPLAGWQVVVELLRPAGDRELAVSAEDGLRLTPAQRVLNELEGQRHAGEHFLGSMEVLRRGVRDTVYHRHPNIDRRHLSLLYRVLSAGRSPRFASNDAPLGQRVSPYPGELRHAVTRHTDRDVVSRKLPRHLLQQSGRLFSVSGAGSGKAAPTLHRLTYRYQCSLPISLATRRIVGDALHERQPC